MAQCRKNSVIVSVWWPTLAFGNLEHSAARIAIRIRGLEDCCSLGQHRTRRSTKSQVLRLRREDLELRRSKMSSRCSFTALSDAASTRPRVPAPLPAQGISGVPVGPILRFCILPSDRVPCSSCSAHLRHTCAAQSSRGQDDQSLEYPTPHRRSMAAFGLWTTKVAPLPASRKGASVAGARHLYSGRAMHSKSPAWPLRRRVCGRPGQGQRLPAHL